MKRRLFNLLSIASLLLCLSTGVLWMTKTVKREDRLLEFSRPSQSVYPHSTYYLDLDNEGICVVRLRAETPPIPGPYLPSDRICTPAIIAWERGFGRCVEACRMGFCFVSMPAVGTDSHRQLWMDGHMLVFRVPCWFLMLIFALAPLYRCLIAYRYARRAKAMCGLCLHCGYDLRATPDRCPECGSPVPAGHIPMVSP